MLKLGGPRIGVGPAVTRDSSLRYFQLWSPKICVRLPHIHSRGLPSLAADRAHHGRHGRAHRGHFASYLRAGLQGRGRRFLEAAHALAARI